MVTFPEVAGMQQLKWVCMIFVGILFAGCSSTDIITKKQMETEMRLEQILQSGSAQASQLADFSRELVELKTRLVAQESDINGIKTDFAAFRLQSAAQSAASTPITSATIEVVNSEPARGGHEADQQEAYMKAFGIFSANRYPEAITAFDSFIAAYPESEYAANAQYWTGECYYTQKNYQKALEAFNVVLLRYPKGKKVPDALLKVAFSQMSLNDQPSARATLQKLIDTYPKSPAAAKARERMNRQ
jgi:tol-pal system protein YbgF